jgi:hypothetical protein
MRKASTGLAGEGDSNSPSPSPDPIPGYNENQSTASVPTVNCLNGGVHPKNVCLGVGLYTGIPGDAAGSRYDSWKTKRSLTKKLAIEQIVIVSMLARK